MSPWPHLFPACHSDRGDSVATGVRRARSGDPCARTDTSRRRVTGEVRTVERAQKRVSGDGPAQGAEASATALELLVHGVGGTTPQAMLNDPSTVRISGDDTAAVFRRAEDVDAESRPEDYRGRPVPEAYVWCNLTSGN